MGLGSFTFETSVVRKTITIGIFSFFVYFIKVFKVVVV